MTGISSQDIANVYATLFDWAKQESLDSQGLHSPSYRTIKKVLSLLGEYNKHLDYQVLEEFSFDTYDDALAPIAKALGSAEGKSKIKSTNLLRYYDRNGETRYQSVIAFTEGLDDIWKRFCIIKEACHAVLFLDQDIGGRYENTVNEEQIAKLFVAVAHAPFSLHDFDSPRYPDALKIENAAEALAFLLLVPFDELLLERRRRIEHGQHRYFDSSTLAERFKVPQRYASIFIGPQADDLVEQVRERLRGYGYEVSDHRPIVSAVAANVPEFPPRRPRPTRREP